MKRLRATKVFFMHQSRLSALGNGVTVPKCLTSSKTIAFASFDVLPLSSAEIPQHGGDCGNGAVKGRSVERFDHLFGGGPSQWRVWIRPANEE